MSKFLDAGNTEENNECKWFLDSWKLAGGLCSYIYLEYSYQWSSS